MIKKNNPNGHLVRSLPSAGVYKGCTLHCPKRVLLSTPAGHVSPSPRLDLDRRSGHHSAAGQAGALLGWGLHLCARPIPHMGWQSFLQQVGPATVGVYK